MLQIDKQINEFIRKYKLECGGTTLQRIQDIIRSQGFSIVYYNHYNNTPEIESLLQCLKVKESSLHTKCFLYADDESRFIFVYDDLSDEDEKALLLHEEGHIFLNHPFKNGFVEDTDVKKENEANYFAITLPRRIELIRRRQRLKKAAWLALGAAAAATAAAVICVSVLSDIPDAEIKAPPAANAYNDGRDPLDGQSDYVWIATDENGGKYAFTEQEAKKFGIHV